MLGEVAAEFAVSGTNVYDLGCSDGITLDTVSSAIARSGKEVHYIGVDYSQAMLDKAAARFAGRKPVAMPTLRFGDLKRRNDPWMALQFTVWRLKKTQRLSAEGGEGQTA
jgi:tRNA (cmo5U34)-methyltransferase